MGQGYSTPDDLDARYVSTGDPQPRLFVVVDTEEEFDWRAPFNRASTGVTAMRHVGRGQALFDAFGIQPTYVIDYPVATRTGGFEPLAAIQAEGRCEIGAHLHPWVTPPFDEEVTRSNSYGCNLPAALEEAKLRTLHEAITARFGAPPRVFKAGRYGLGLSTVGVLGSLRFEVDASVNPTLAASADGGPDFRAFDSRPFRFGTTPLFEVPCSHGYAGWSGTLRRPIHDMASKPQLAATRLVGIFSRLGVVNRIMLSPETSTLEEMIALTRALYREGLRLFSLTFHSPSLDVGHTPYVRTPDDLDRFLTRIRKYCDFFFGEFGGTPSTPTAFRASVLASQVTTS